MHVQEAWEEPAGGGAVAAVQLARLSGGCLFVTALGDDDRGHAAKRDLEAMGVEVRAVWRSEPQRRAFVYLDASGERTITVIGQRLDSPGRGPPPVARARALRRDLPDRRRPRCRPSGEGRQEPCRDGPRAARAEPGRRRDRRAGGERERRGRAIQRGRPGSRASAGCPNRRRRRRGAAEGGRHQHKMGTRTAARAGCGHVRRRRLVRGGPHLWAGRGPGSGGGSGARRSLRRGLRDRAGAVRGTALERSRPSPVVTPSHGR